MAGRIKRIALGIAMAAVLLAGTGGRALAADTKLPDSFLIGDSDGISVSETGDYMINAVNLAPGDVVSKAIIIRNLEIEGSYALSLVAEPVGTTGPMNLLDNLFLRLTYNSKVLYEGRLRGDGQGTRSYAGTGTDIVRNALPLGEYASGDYGRIDVEIIADFTDADNLTKSTADIRWKFTAAETTPGKDGPKTGETVRTGLYILLLALLTAAAVTWLRLKKLKGAAETARLTRLAAGHDTKKELNAQ
jgi:hypothetical protein